MACGAGRQNESNSAHPEIAVLFVDTQGMRTSAASSATWILSMEELERLYAGFSALQLSAAATPVPEIDFDHHRVLLVEMGQKPTGGYAVHLNPDSPDASTDTALVNLQWKEPEPSSVVPQVITSPFILLKMEKGNYTAVRVMDQHHQTLFDLPVIK